MTGRRSSLNSARTTVPPRPTDPATRAREHVLAEHRELLETTIECADRVADAWSDPPTEREGVVVPMRAALVDAGALDRYADALAGAAQAAGLTLQAKPVAAPPYVAVTSTGPVARATGDVSRLVVRVETFAVARAPTRYVRANETAETALSVELR